MQGAQSRLRERIENISIDIHLSEARKRDYIDKKLSAHKKEQDARMEEIRTLIKSSSPSSSSRRRHSSHKSAERGHDASANRPRPHLHGDHHHVRDQHRHEGQVTSKHHVHDDDERHLLRAQARQRHHHHEDAPQAQVHKSQQALLKRQVQASRAQKKTARRPPPRRCYDYNNHFGIFAKCYQGIFAFGRTASSPTSHEFAYIDIFNNKATTYERGRHFHIWKPLKEDDRREFPMLGHLS